MQIVLASGNSYKLREIQQVFSTFDDLPIQLKLLPDTNIPEPDEPFDTFMQNAEHKVKYYAKYTQTNTLSEDGGLCIAALAGFPGVRTKDFILECGGREQAYLELEKMLTPHTNYRAYFVCAAVLYLPEQNKYLSHEGICHGTISFPARGDAGFGFDPIFIPDGYDTTFAQLGADVKNTIGHRAQAIIGLAQQLKLQFSSL